MFWVYARHSEKWWPKSLILVSSDQSTFLHTFGELPTCLLANSKRAFLLLTLSNGFFLATLPESRALESVRLFVVSVVELCNSFRVAFGLCAASLLNALLTEFYCEFWWAALSWQVCFDTMFFPFEDDGFDGAPGIIKNLDIFL